MVLCVSVIADTQSLWMDSHVPVISYLPLKTVAGYSAWPTIDEIYMPFNLVILLVRIYLKSVTRRMDKDTCTGTFIAWKEQMPSTNDRLKKYAQSYSVGSG